MAKTPKCLEVLTAAMKKTRFMDDGAAIDFLKEIQKRAAKKQEQENMNAKDALQKSSDEIIEEQKAEAKQRARRAYLDLRAIVLLRDFTNLDVFDSRSQGLNAALTGDLRYKPSQRNSLHYAMLNMQSELTGDLFRAMSKDNLFDEFVQNKDFQRDIANEVQDPKSTGNDQAFLAAKHIKATLEKARKLLNKAGANIKDVEDFIANTTHNRQQMLSATGKRLENTQLYFKLRAKLGSFKAANEEMKRLAYVRWRDFIMPLLDREKTFKDVLPKDVEDFMLKSYKAIVTGRHLKDTVENTATIGDFKKIQPISRIKQLDASRVFRFKKGEGWFDYNNKFGTGSLATAIFRTLERSGKNIAMMRRFGPSSTKTFNITRDDILADPIERDSKGSTGRLNVAQNMWDWASGVSKVPVNQTLADWSLAFRQFVTLVRLPLVVITAFQDVANRAQEFRVHGISFEDSWKKVFQPNLRGLSSKQKLERASLFRVFNTGLMGTFASRMAAFDSPEGMMSNLMAKFWKYNGMNRWDRTNSQAHALALGSHLGSLKDVEFDNLNPLERRLLLQYDIKKAEWDYYRKNATFVEGTDKTVFIAPDIVRQIGNKGLDDFLDASGIEKTDAAREQALEDLSEKLGMYFIDRTSHAILIPDLRESTLILGSSQPGTVYGEAMRQIALFKTFSVSFARKLWGRPLYGGNLKGNKNVLAVVEIMATSTLMGMGILDLKLAGQGKEPREFGSDFIIASFLQGGGMGIWGDFLFGQYNRFGQSLTGTFEGPGIGTINDFATFMDKLVKMDHPGQAAAQFLGRNTPFINIWFLKTALNYLFLYSLAEYLSPGYLARMQRNLAKQQDEQFIAPPSQFALRPFG
jgi:hypothetical protein